MLFQSATSNSQSRVAVLASRVMVQLEGHSNPHISLMLMLNVMLVVSDDNDMHAKPSVMPSSNLAQVRLAPLVNAGKDTSVTEAAEQGTPTLERPT